MRRSFLKRAVVAIACAAGFGVAAAETYPDHTIQVIVPYSAGGPTDGRVGRQAGRQAREASEGAQQEARP